MQRKAQYAHAVAYAENFHWGGLVQGHMVVISIWGALFVTSQFDSFPCFQTNVLAKFVDIICIFYIQSPYFMCHWTEYKLSALQVRISEKNKLNATTRSSLHQSNLQLQHQAALRSRQTRAVEHWMCAAGLADAHLVCKIEFY